jgi:hypothetical protein
VNVCSGCRADFGSVSAFDAHRVGALAYPFDRDHLDGRRCLDVEELAAKGWRQDSHGRWRQPPRVPRLPLIFSDRPGRFAVSPNRPRQAQGGVRP